MEMCLGSIRRSIKAENAASLPQISHDAHCDEVKGPALEYVVSSFDEISRRKGIKALSHELLLHVLSARPLAEGVQGVRGFNNTLAFTLSKI
jgi:hypothetical protein